MLKRILLVFVILFFVSVGLLAIWVMRGTSQHKQQLQAEVQSFQQSIQPVQGRYQAQLTKHLPSPIQRYLRYALREGQPFVKSVALVQKGVIRTGPKQDWMPITAQQYFSINPPGFLWSARAQSNPLLWIHARDHYRKGRGSMLIRLLSTIEIADAKGPEIDQGALMRYVAEMMWFPTSFLQKDRLQWKPIDAQRAQLTFQGKHTRATLIFTINSKDQLVRVEGLRYRDNGIQQNWYGKASHYKTFQGIKIPTQVEVAWAQKTGDFTYTRLQITDIHFQ
ncbi:MAG: hypothetical protein H6728_06695 [Myxococcales bacterium]|nr:hypothetical protein [Myxococcales bacterium]MCB9642749.1 hypothetical protein [Myxococcales bacterium]